MDVWKLTQQLIITDYRFSALEEATADQVKEHLASIPSDKSFNDIMPMRVYEYFIYQIVQHFTHFINLSHLLHPSSKMGTLRSPITLDRYQFLLSLGKVYRIFC